VNDIVQLPQREFPWELFQNQFLPNLFESSASILVYQTDGLLAANQYFQKEFGYQGKDLKQINDSLWRHPEEMKRFKECLNLVLSGKKMENAHFLLVKGDGDEVRVKIQFGKLPIKDREPTCVCMLMANAPTSHSNEVFKNWSEDIFKLIAENSLAGIVLINDKFECIYVNPAALAIYGYDSLEEGLKVPITSTIAPESLKIAAERSKNWLEGRDNPPLVTYKIIRRDGQLRDVEVMTGTVMVNGVRCHLHSIIDITDRLRAEKSVLESELKYRLLAENVSDVIWTTDLQWNLTYISPSVATMFGYSIEVAQSISLDNFLLPGSLEFAKDYFAKAIHQYNMNEFEPYTLELQSHHQDGHLFWVEVKLSYFHDQDSKPIGILGVTRDITMRKQAEDALMEAERRLSSTLKEEVRHLRSKDYKQPYGADITFHQYPSPAMRQMREDARIASLSDGNLLITGPSGAGKNFLAGWIHLHSSRAEGPFFDLNCTSIAPSLVESELFGHEPGSFTGSRGRKRGLLELANGGTLFLDEIGDLCPALQAKLLQFFDTHAIRRIGGETHINVNARVIAATNRKLETLVRTGHFREDLYYRLNVLTILVPPLSERREDIPILAGEILKKLAQDMGLLTVPVLTQEALKDLSKHDWPGNIRELKNVLERVLLKNQDQSVIESSILNLQNNNSHLDKPSATGKSDEKSDFVFNEEISGHMKEMIEAALKKAKTKQQAAKLLGISRHALSRYMIKLGISDRK